MPHTQRRLKEKSNDGQHWKARSNEWKTNLCPILPQTLAILQHIIQRQDRRLFGKRHQPRGASPVANRTPMSIRGTMVGPRRTTRCTGGRVRSKPEPKLAGAGEFDRECGGVVWVSD
jgi:hypothetical protein